MTDFNILIAPEDLELSSPDSSGLIFEKQHAYVGKFKKPGQPSFELTEDTLKHMAQETNRYIENGNLCTVPLEHTTDPEKNRGFNSDWNVKKDSKGRMGLFSKVTFRDKEAAKLALSTQTSIFVPPKFTDGSQNEYVRPIRHTALTTVPVLNGLGDFMPISASLSNGDSQQEDVMPLSKLADDLGLELSEGADASELISLAFMTKDEEISALQLSFDDYKKLNPPKIDPIRVSPAQVKMLRENRELKLSSLVEKGNILPCVKKLLEEKFCTDAGLTLSLSGEDADDGFDAIADALRDNDSLKLSEATRPQVKDVSSILDASINPVIANAMRRANGE